MPKKEQQLYAVEFGDEIHVVRRYRVYVSAHSLEHAKETAENLKFDDLVSDGTAAEVSEYQTDNSAPWEVHYVAAATSLPAGGAVPWDSEKYLDCVVEVEEEDEEEDSRLAGGAS